MRLLARDQKLERVHPLPPRIQCGHLRSAIRSVFPSGLTPVQELSIKTAQKLELGHCSHCESGVKEILRQWKEERFSPASCLDVDHVRMFKRALSCIVERGWNLRTFPYIPNGNATRSFSRREGGSWNREEFSDSCRAELVFSSGKPRVVTLYSGHQSEVLSPLHDALYGSLKEKGWLLVGSPTDELVKRLNGDGPYVSVDYQSATDMIRAEYVRAAVQVLIDKGVGLTGDQVRALRVVCELRLDGSPEVATRGQPMGSLISFPLLCLINKAVVDLALADMASAGKLTWKEFRVHRCLINGDDLLYREPNNSPDRPLLAGILRHGGAVGLVVNREKTMVDADWAEINSTPFFQGVRRKKTNVAVLQRSAKVTDVIGFLADSIVHRAVFRDQLLRWKEPLSKVRRKLQGPIPPSFYSALWVVSDALRAVPSAPPKRPNPFPVVEKPALYDLTREEEVCYISERVARLREQGYVPEKSVWVVPTLEGEQSIQRALRKEKPSVEDNILKVLADGWERKTKEKLWLEDEAEPVLTTWAWDERSKVELLLDAVRAFRQRKLVGCANLDAGALPSLGGCAFSRGDDFIGFE